MAGRVVKLERLKRPTGSGFYMIWGADETDFACKVREAKDRGDLSPGDKFDAQNLDPSQSSTVTAMDEAR